MEGLDLVEAVAVVKSRGINITIDDLVDEIYRGELKADRVNGEYIFKLGNFVDWLQKQKVKTKQSL